MMKPKEKQKLKIICDGGILLAALFAGTVLRLLAGKGLGTIFLAAGILCAAAFGADLVFRLRPPGQGEKKLRQDPFAVRELVLLNEEDHPIKSWNLMGKTSLIIGRKNQDEEVDVDLGDCAYGALVEPQHAVLNFSCQNWYLEDISQENGIRVQKAQDGIPYRLGGRPCRVGAGDVIYIANTKLLLT